MHPDEPALEIATETEMLRVEVVYALPQRQWLLSLELTPGASVRDAIVASNILALVPGLNPDPEAWAEDVGIFSEAVSLDTRLRDGDRVELYRPLQIDPKESRRRRALND